MHKTVSVSIGASLFVIEESAYAKLDAYLKAIRGHFASSPDAEEILSDIEDRIGEELSETLSVRKKVILMKDVEDVICAMGTIEDFQQFDADVPAGDRKSGDDALPPWKKLKLYRDADDQIIGGVCAGIAKYLGLDPLIIRLAFGLSLLLGGFGVILYILLWILLPEARTTAEKVEMTGGRVTLSAIQNRIDATLPPEKRKSMLNTLFTLPFAIIGTVLRALGRVLRVLFPLAGRLLGLLILVACSFAIAMMTFVLLALLFNPTSPYIGFPLAASLSAWSYVTLLLSAYAAVILPLIFVILFGASLVSLRNVFTMPAVTALGSVWFFMLVVGGVTAFTVGPQIETAVQRYEAEHHAMVTTPFDLRDFTVIEVGGITRLEVTKGDAFKAELESAKDDVALINLAVKDGILTLERSHRNDRCIFFCGDRGHTLRVTMPSLQKLETSGVAYATVNGFSEEEAMFSASGNSYIEAALDAQTMNINLSGVSHISLKGTGTKLMSVLSGNSTLSASAFSVKTAVVSLSGVSQAMIDASEEITGEASGNSSLYYEQEPAKLEVETSGVSAVRQREEDDGYEQW